MKNEATSKRVATVAARILNLGVRPGGRIYYENVNGDLFIAPFSFGEMKAVAASALTQTADIEKNKAAKKKR